jgi:putative peptidoglycan lipid II flippase
MFLSPLFLGISSVIGAILQSFKRFFVYSLSPIMYNLGIIFGALFLAPKWGIYGLAWGVVLGAFLHMLVQVPALLRLNFRYYSIADLKDKYFREIAIMMVPRTLSLAVTQLNLVVITIIASTLKGGSLMAFNLANNVQGFPIGIFGVSFAIAAFPTLSAYAFDNKKLVQNFSHVFREILFFVIPITAIILILRAQIVRLLFGHGKFDWSSTQLTFETLGFFAISLFAQATIPLLIRVFYARRNSFLPFAISLFSALINVVLAYTLAPIYGVSGLALAFSISSIINFILLWISLRVTIGQLDTKKISRSIFVITLATLVSAIAMQHIKTMVGDMVDMQKVWGIILQAGITSFIGLGVYLLTSWLLGSHELHVFIDSIKERFNRKKIEKSAPPQELI